MNRRSFLFYSVTAGIATCLKAENIFIPAKEPDILTVDLNSELTESGSNKATKKIIVVRIKEGNEPDSFTALSRKCTHRGCKISFNKELNHFRCPCHKSEFALNGEVLKGPAQKALQKYTVIIKDNTLTVNVE